MIGPELADIAGNRLDQDGDGIAGEDADDRFAYSLPVHKLGNNLLLKTDTSEMNEAAGVPTRTGIWSGDLTYVTRFYKPPWPPQGEYATRFVETTASGPAAGSISSDLWYLIDLAPYASDIANGQAVLWAAALFNRELVGPTYDTQCEIEVSAYAGTPATFSEPVGDE